MTSDPRLDRQVLGSLRSAGGTGVVRVEYRYSTGIDELWSALTDPAAWPAGTARWTVSSGPAGSSACTWTVPTWTRPGAWKRASLRTGYR